jgi:hypothetical protein
MSFLESVEHVPKKLFDTCKVSIRIGKHFKNKYQKNFLSKLRSDDNEIMKESFGLIVLQIISVGLLVFAFVLTIYVSSFEK